MKIYETTPQGSRVRTLTEAETAALAAEGNYAAKLEVAKKKIATATSLQDELDAIKELLGLM